MNTKPDRPATRKFVMEAFNNYNQGLVGVVKGLQKRIATLEKEVEQLRARPLQKWAGVFVPGVRYTEASLATHQGSLWVATTATSTTPGEAGGDWRLIVKRGHV